MAFPHLDPRGKLHWPMMTGRGKYVLKNIVHQTVARLGQPADIATAACLIASPLSDFMTGTTFRIDVCVTPTV
jgi:NAD(P)-dependent dehydrogenase (short-subunit alcohol dehydrogenase family)